jgi:hypothetical protein
MEGRTVTKEDKETMSQDDPIFAAIEVHRAAWDANMATMELTDKCGREREGPHRHSS